MIETDLTRLNIRLGDIKNAIRHSPSGSPPYLWEMKKEEIEDYLRKHMTEEEVDSLYRWIRANIVSAKIDPRYWPLKGANHG